MRFINIKSYPNNKILNDEFGGLRGGTSLKSYKQKIESMQHKNTFSQSDTYSADYEQIKYNMRRSTLKIRKSRIDKSLKKYDQNIKESLVLECKFIVIISYIFFIM